MKTKFLKLAGAFCALLLIHSCQKDELPLNAKNDSNLIEEERATGYIPSTPEQLAQLRTLKTSSLTRKEAIPARYELPELPVALNQRSKGSCVPYSIAHAITLLKSESKTLVDGSPDFSIYPSGDYIYEKYKEDKNTCNDGVYFWEALDALKTEGTPSYTDMGYVNCGVLPNASQQNNAAKNRIFDYAVIRTPDGFRGTIEDMKRQIAKGNPVIIGMEIDRDFVSSSIRLWDKNNSAFYGNHAVVLTGYDDEKQAFRLLNSWGSNWGENGYIWATYSKIDEAMHGDVYVIQKDNPLTYRTTDKPFIYIGKDVSSPADNIHFPMGQPAPFIKNGEFYWNNSSVIPYFEQYINPTLVLGYHIPANNEGIDIDGDFTFEVRIRIESSKNTTYPANTAKGLQLNLWNGNYGGINKSMSCTVPMEGLNKETVFTNTLGETYRYVVDTYVHDYRVTNNSFERDRTIRFHIKDGKFFFENTSIKMPSGLNRLRDFDIKNIGTIGAITDIRVYKNGKIMAIDNFDTKTPWMQFYE
ncbi:C1 family peptidase [Flavobacterium sp.]|uniref:C1 family peptidase n=1 Tax=Flavobacterium sp. TaxID=239 RepID=UPI0031D9E661